MSLPRRDTGKSLSEPKGPPKKVGTNTESSAQTVSKDSVTNQEPTQILEDRYLDRDKLTQYLEKKHPGQWRLQVKLGRWMITAPEIISDNVLDELSQ